MFETRKCYAEVLLNTALLYLDMLAVLNIVFVARIMYLVLYNIKLYYSASPF